MAGTLATAESTVSSSLDDPVSGRQTSESAAPQLDRIAHKWCVAQGQPCRSRPCEGPWGSPPWWRPEASTRWQSVASGVSQCWHGPWRIRPSDNAVSRAMMRGRFKVGRIIRTAPGVVNMSTTGPPVALTPVVVGGGVIDGRAKIQWILRCSPYCCSSRRSNDLGNLVLDSTDDDRTSPSFRSDRRCPRPGQGHGRSRGVGRQRSTIRGPTEWTMADTSTCLRFAGTTMVSAGS